MSIAIGAYFFLIAFILAHLEIQIEGPHGWAEKLPTWRWDSPGVRRWFGKPVTGYHLCLVTLILLVRARASALRTLPGSARQTCSRCSSSSPSPGIFSGSRATATSAWAGSARARSGGFPPGRSASPALPTADRAFPLRRARAGALDRDVGGPCPALEHGLLRAARPDGHRDRLHPPSAAAGAGSSTRVQSSAKVKPSSSISGTLPRPRAGETRLRPYDRWSQRRSLRTGPSRPVLADSSSVAEDHPSGPRFAPGTSSARPAWRAWAASPISSPRSATTPWAAARSSRHNDRGVPGAPGCSASLQLSQRWTRHVSQ